MLINDQNGGMKPIQPDVQKSVSFQPDVKSIFSIMNYRYYP